MPCRASAPEKGAATRPSRGCIPAARAPRSTRARGRGGDREVELAPCARLALDPDSPVVGVDDAPGDVKAKTEASLIVLAHLPEALEHRFQHAGRYPRAG